MPLLSLSSISRHFVQQSSGLRAKRTILKAVDNLNLCVNPGEIVGLVGESGSGKSTLAKLIVQLLQPTSGSIAFEGRNYATMNRTEKKAFRSSVQIVFQNPYLSLNPRQTVQSILEEGLRIHRQELSAHDRLHSMKQVLADVELPMDMLQRYPHECSGGQRQRIAIARVLCLQPKLLILDEPVSSLDVTIQKQVMQLLKKLHTEHQLSYLFISHDLPLVESFCQRVYIMKDGQIVEEGESRNVFQQPKHVYTKQLLETVYRLPNAHG